MNTEKIITEYIKELKNKIFLIQVNLPEFWMHEDLIEIEVIYRTITELKNLIKLDDEMDEIKIWIKSWNRSV